MSYNKIPSGATLKPTKFEASVTQQELDDFRQLIRLSKIGPKTYENIKEDRFFGISHSWLSKAKQHWETDYDWRKTEARINSVPNFKATIKDDDGDEYDIHFAALFSEKKDAVPIALLHGWPGSFLEFLDMLEILKSKYTPAELPYHVVVPSLPGYGYSAGPSMKTDWKTEDIARICDKLMVGLGCKGYVAQGGDIGSFTARILSGAYPACRGIHLNFCMMSPPKGVPEDAVNAAEKKGLARAADFSHMGDAYAREHGTRPATVGLVLSSSPIALLAWISEKFLVWSDDDPSLDAILDSVSLYWFTESFPRAIFPYRQYFGATSTISHNQPEYYNRKPLGYSWFPMELAPIPVAWVATTGNLVFHRAHDAGGHFAAMEKPDVLLQDIEDFIKDMDGPELSSLKISD